MGCGRQRKTSSELIIMGARRSLYLRPTKDKDLIDYITPLLTDFDFSVIVRDLMRDGMKYRLQPVSAAIQTRTVTQSNTPDFSQVVLTKNEVSDSDLESRLDDF